MSTAPVDTLRRVVRGDVLTPTAPGYDDARRVWNAAVDRRPAAIVRCSDEDDVRAVVRYARAENLPLSVRAGGHSIGGHGVVADGIVIDLRALRDIAVDADGGMATIGAGCTWGDVLQRLRPLGRATPGGFDTRIGVAGLTLGGGYGALTRVHGMACDNLVGADLVDADGRGVRVDAQEQPDLLWALRGAGANFGVTASLCFRLHPVPPLLAGTIVHPIERGAALLALYREVVADLPDATSAFLSLETVPGGPGHAFVTAFHFGNPADGERLLAPLRRFDTPLYDDVGERGYEQIHIANLDTFPEGHHNAWRACFLRGLDDNAAAALIDHAMRARGMGSYVVIEHLGGAMARVRPDETAFPHRRAPFGVAIALRWAPSLRPERSLRIAEELHAALRPSAIGTYVNYLGADYTAGDVAAAYGTNLPRLRELKRRYDPDNLFRSNVNILP